VRALRARAIDVFLVELPTSRWFDERMRLSPGGIAYHGALPRLADLTGARLLDKWPDSLWEESRFWDDVHMVAASTIVFTEALAEAIKKPQHAF
jgi:lysophospholipase L1-like esterase